MTRAVWDTLLTQVQALHHNAPDLAAFCDWPGDIKPQSVDPYHIPAAQLMETDAALDTSHPAATALLAASPHAKWRETYKGTQITGDFMDRFGCYCLIGTGGAFTSAKISSYVVYMPAHLDYPAHHHPAEEMYLMLSGSATFQCGQAAPETLQAGQSSQHASNEPHATKTGASPMLAYVVWRNNLGIPPIWTAKDLR